MICVGYGAVLEINKYFHSIIAAHALFTSVLTIILNSIYLISVIKFSRNLLPIDVMYIFLSVSDLLTGLLSTSSWCLTWILAIHHSKHYCSIWAFFSKSGHFLNSMSFMPIAFITIDIYLSVIYPFFHERHVSILKSFISVIMSWFLAITVNASFSLMSFKKWYIYELITAFVAIFSTIVFSLVHLKVYCEIKDMCKKVPKSNSNQINILKAKKRASSLGIKILAAFILSFLPISTCFMYRNFIGTSTFLISYPEQIALCVLSLNPLLDPFVYYFRLSRIRSRIYRLFYRGTVCPNRP